jgi:hypothetical protein
MATILPATTQPPTMANRLKKFANSVKKKSTELWPKYGVTTATGGQGFEVSMLKIILIPDITFNV